jgi:hypothetical protein
VELVAAEMAVGAILKLVELRARQTPGAVEAAAITLS